METETENVHRAHRWLVIIALSIIAIALAFLADTLVATWINAYTSVGIKRLMGIVSQVGDWPAHIALGLLLAAIALLRGSKRWARIFFAMLVACALAGIAARVGKIAIGRPRPATKVEERWKGPSLRSKFNAFPSGHTASSTGFFVTLLLARKRIGAPLLPIPLLIGASRMIVAAHYLSDVAGGFALGVIAAIFVGERLQIENSKSEIRN